MKTLCTPRRTLLTRALRAAALAAAQPALARLSPLAAASAATQPVAVRPGSPIALRLPTVGLAASVEPVWLALPDASQTAPDRLTLEGAPLEIDLPANPNVAGWYALSAIPGQPGDALLVGHVDTAYGPAVFTRLPQLRVGSEIVLELEGAAPVTFVLDTIRRHPAHLPAPADLFRTEGPARLHLATCTGSFVRSRGGYQDRLILSATPVAPVTSELPPDEALQSP